MGSVVLAYLVTQNFGINVNQPKQRQQQQKPPRIHLLTHQQLIVLRLIIHLSLGKKKGKFAIGWMVEVIRILFAVNPKLGEVYLLPVKLVLRPAVLVLVKNDVFLSF